METEVAARLWSRVVHLSEGLRAGASHRTDTLRRDSELGHRQLHRSERAVDDTQIHGVRHSLTSGERRRSLPTWIQRIA